MYKKVQFSDYIWLAIFGIGALIAFSLQIYLVRNNVQQSPSEETLFSALQFGLTLGFGWALQRLDAKKQFQESLKNYGLSAHRRIKDIERAIDRLLQVVDQLRRKGSAEISEQLFAIQLVAEGMTDTARSSVIDWADVIGEDLLKKEKLEQLQREQSSVYENSTKQSIEKTDLLKNEINRLRSELPLIIRYEMESKEDLSTRRTRISNVLVRYYEGELYTDDSITLKIESLEDVTKDLIEEIKSSSPYKISVVNIEDMNYLVFNDNTDNEIGTVINPLETNNVHGNDFAFTLFTMLAIIYKFSNGLDDPPRGPDIPIPECEIFTFSSERRNFYIRIRVNQKTIFGVG